MVDKCHPLILKIQKINPPHQILNKNVAMVCIIWLNIHSYKIIFYVNFNDEKMVLQIKSWQPKINKNRKQGIHGRKSVNFLTRRYISKGELNLNLNGPYPCG
jgi:hypothetical protein